MGFTMSLNLLLLMAMVATNFLSLYHLSSNLQTVTSPSPTHSPVPDHLLRQLRTIRATINHLTRRQPSSDTSASSSSTAVPPDLLIYSQLSPIASSCHNQPDLLHKYMSYSPFSICPNDFELQETLILNGCHPLPRRRCFSKTASKSFSNLPQNPFPSSLPDSSIIWSKYSCKSFSCTGFDLKKQRDSVMTFSSEFLNPRSESDNSFWSFLKWSLL